MIRLRGRQNGQSGLVYPWGLCMIGRTCSGKLIGVCCRICSRKVLKEEKNAGDSILVHRSIIKSCCNEWR